MLTYIFEEKGDHTVLTDKEEFIKPLDEEAFKDAPEGWEFALKMVKEIAEAL